MFVVAEVDFGGFFRFAVGFEVRRVGGETATPTGLILP
jgi:hypothetical protein